MSNNAPKRQNTVAQKKKNTRSKPLQNKKRKLKFKGSEIPKGKKPKKY